MTGVFEGQSALITGGGSGIGFACAKAFARDGAHVTLFGRNAEKLAAAAQQITDAGGAADVLAGDTAVEADIAGAIANAVRAGRLTVAVANAGTGTVGPVTATSLEQWNAVLTTNLTGAFLTFKHAGAAMAQSGGGALCAISSIAGARTHRLMGAYCVSKAGIDMLVRNSADELGAANVRVNSVLPGLVDTELAAGLFAVPAILEDYLNCMPIRRTGTVDDIAAAVRFLCGPEAGWITGVNLSVDGGHHLRRGPNIDVFGQSGGA